jgi:glycosyltransferase involved in cell wall biosynthesis
MSKKKILLLSDDLRMSSGVGTMSREFVMGTLHKYDWVQMGGAIKHPEEGKIVDMNDAIRKETGITDASLKIYPISGYGNQEMLREVINVDKPDGILIYTDPRFWVWLFQMEHEIRQHIPIMYYNIWDSMPWPMWNREYYDSVDSLFNISKQTVDIVKNVRSEYEPWQVTYSPHGINEDQFYPLDEVHEEWDEFQKYKTNVLGPDVDFVMFYNNRNIRRKVPGDIILAYKSFCDQLTPEQSSKCALIMHTQPIDKNGTDLPEVAREMAPDCKVIFSHQKLDTKYLNFLYNIADVTVNMASNEGFGLGTAESLMAGTPIIVNVTGGMQDQCGFKFKDKYLTSDDYEWVHTLHDDTKWKNNPDLTCGEWVKPVWPSCRSLQGSVPTPYIFDDRCRFDEVADNLKEWYDDGHDLRKSKGLSGREFVLSDDGGMSSKHMCHNFVRDIDSTLKNWKPRKRFTLCGVTNEQ